jgi:hypothetical protein
MPAWIARCTFGCVPNDVSITGRVPGTWRRISSIAASPSLTSAATAIWSAGSSTVRIPALTTGSSSAISTLIISAHPARASVLIRSVRHPPQL